MADDRIEKLRETVTDLVRKFEANKGAYKAASFLEANLRLEFIDELFDGLGWDVHNKKGLPPRRKEVIVERGESGDRPDYNLRIDGVPVLYVETKQPSEDLDKTAHIMQAKTYAWSGKHVKVVGLTDFEEFRLFDATLKPNARYPDQGEIFRLPYTAYLDNLDKLLLLHRDAVAEGSLDGLLLKDKKSVAQRKPVDKEFLNDLNAWRLMLGKGLYKKSGYTYCDHEISDLVQHLLDRILFVRIAEERDVIEPRQLADKLKYWKESKQKYSLYKDILVPLFREINNDVDGDLLKPSHVDQAPFADDDVAEFIEELYPPKSIYRFDEMPIELIGAAYEQYLGNVIRCTPKQVKLEPKAEVRKAGGVYYTPEYIVDYIVENTVGNLVEGKTPEEVERLRILDPACGSGSFLIGALEYLIDYVAGYYREHPDEAGRDQIFPFLVEDYERGEERLSIERKVRLLENCIYGVDIDTQAVEVTKLSLYLKVLEGERRLPRKHALLKSLDKNIKCGNSLIGSEYFEGQLMPDEKERRRVNPFDWEVEFEEIMNSGGFDAVIGNPPWGQKEITKEKTITDYLKCKYTSIKGIFDLFRPFVEQGNSLVKKSGFWGMVLPDIVLLKDYPDTRAFLINNTEINHIEWWGMAFEDAMIDAVTIITKKERPKREHIVFVKVHEGDTPLENKIRQISFLENPRYVFNLFLTEPDRVVLAELDHLPKVGDFFEIHEGVHSGNIREELFIDEKVDDSCYELIFGRDEIRPYFLKWNGRYIRLSVLPATRTKKRYANLGRREWYEQLKVIVRRTGDYVLAAVDTLNYFVSNNFFLVIPKAPCSLDLYGLCALLNTDFFTWFFRTIEPRKGRVFSELKIKHIRNFPLPNLVGEENGCRYLNEMGLKRVSFAGDLFAARTAHDEEVLNRSARKLDKEIENYVREIFGFKGLNPDHK